MSSCQIDWGFSEDETVLPRNSPRLDWKTTAWLRAFWSISPKALERKKSSVKRVMESMNAERSFSGAWESDDLVPPVARESMSFHTWVRRSKLAVNALSEAFMAADL